ncbi:uncharacterized protein LTR77_006181 [Saxophila tyrrhenica]|uniref:Ribosome quality control complex subunit 2 n=1 Tax=Saxophila tyrrhenica TaxID=1690608 RepID=A0AAV9PB31_9PEZI|nr:hypothetical protein LTR77_006181 [Saxophila tyrrhenica]
MKQRFSSLDVKVIAHELAASLVGLRLSNAYDLSTRIFLLRFARPNRKEQLLIDSGFRCHLTSFARSTAAAPGHFVARLRKFLRTRRVTKVEQIGTDRVLEIQFSDGLYRLFLEFYAGGNIILTDSDCTILSLLRTVSEGDEHEQHKLGTQYNISLRQNYAGVPELTKERLRDGLQTAVEKQEAEARKPGKKVKKKAGDALRKALAVTTTEFPPILLDHALHVSQYDRGLQPEEVIRSEELMDKLLEALQEAQRVVKEITSADVATGYIVAKRQQSQAASSEDQVSTAPDGSQSLPEGYMYDDFHPFKPAHLAADSSLAFLDYEGFNRTADEFFSSLEGQKLESRLMEREETAKRKLQQARDEQAKRLDGLQQVQELNIRKASAIEANVERVEEAVAAVNGLVGQGMDWVDIGRLIENEQARHNAVAETIKLPLKLQENTVTLLLAEYDTNEVEEEFADETDSEDSDNEDAQPQPRSTDDKRLAIDIDLALSAFANARQYYNQRRSAAEKKERTAQASQKALKNTEQKVMADLKKGLKQEKDVLRPVRKQMWFEKFIYFISSDGYLVLAGRDAQQNELLYRRYLRKGDIYVHADLHGAATVIIKNNPKTPEAPIPPSTLSQAGNLAVCTSSAWDSKAAMSAWWVNAEQVSKTAPTGEYLTTGGFMVRGKKNFLPPAQLLLGFAVLFRISEESKARHVKHRVLESRAQTPDLTDGETIFSGNTSGTVTDAEDDLSDAEPAPPVTIANADDDFPGDAQDNESSDDDLPDESAYDDRGPRSNPLQSTPLGSAGLQTNDVPLDQNGSNNQSPAEEGRGESAGPRAPEPENVEEHAEDMSEDENNGADGSTPDSGAEPLSQSTTSTARPGKQKQAPRVRGKHGKAKKMAAKYAEQDEEDRKAAMKLLGSKAGDQKRQEAAVEKAAQMETAEEARARRKAQHEKAQQQGLAAEEIKRLNMEEGVDDLDEEESSALTSLDSLVGTPLPGDEIIEVVPVCAPWAALNKYKYKVKMQPGQQKKGKALREIFGKWSRDASQPKNVDPTSSDIEKIWEREIELIKGMKEAEVVGVIPVKQMRLQMAGGGEKGKGGKGGKSGARGGKGSKRR